MNSFFTTISSIFSYKRLYNLTKKYDDVSNAINQSNIVLILALNDKEILGQALIFLLAGYETVSTLLSFFFYVMATEPTIQEKLYEEIQQEIGNVRYH